MFLEVFSLANPTAFSAPSVVSVIEPTTLAFLAPDHQHFFTDAAISLDVAMRTGAKTVRSALDLPNDLRPHFNPEGQGGVLLPHGHMDGSVSFTYRPDTPPQDADGKTRKYLKQPDRESGQALSVHPDMLERVGKGFPVVLVEGDKGYLSAVTNAPEDILIVGVPGCWGWSRGGIAVPDLQALVEGAPAVYICFDGDVKGGAVRDAADRLTEALEMFGVPRKGIRYVILPAATKLSLDDVLGGYDEGLRPGFFANMLAATKSSLGHRPAAKKKPKVEPGITAAECDWDMGEMRDEVRTETWDDGTKHHKGGEVILRAAIRQVRTVMTTDDLLPLAEPPTRMAVIQVAVGEAGTRERQERTLEVPQDLLLQPRALLIATDIAEVSTIHVPHASSPQAETLRRMIVESDEVEDFRIERRIAHAGWATTDDGTLAFLHEGGAITAEGNTDEMSAFVEGHGRGKLCFTDPTSVTDKAAAMAAIYEFKATVKPAVFYALLGATYRGLSDLPSGGSLNLVGLHGSGKSMLTKNFLHVLPKAVWQTMKGHTEAALRLFTVGMHNLPMLLDDLAITSDVRATEEMTRAFISFVRAAYDGPETGRMHTVESAVPGKRVLANLQQNDPLLIFSSEEKLDRDPSTMERTLTIRQGTLSPEKAVEAKRIGAQVAESGRLHEGFVLTIQHIAAGIEMTMQNNRFAASTAKRTGVTIEGVDTTARQELRLHHARVLKMARGMVQRIAEGTRLRSSRQMDVIANIALGVYIYADAWCGVVEGVYTEEFSPRGELEKAISAMVAEAADDTDDPGALMLDSMRQAVAAGMAVIAGGEEKPKPEDQHKTKLGSHCNLRGAGGKSIPAIAFYAEAIAKILPTRTTKMQVGLALRGKVILSSANRTLRTVSVDGKKIGCLVVPLSVWEGDLEEEDNLVEESSDK